jgi:hypothetical protein
MADDLQSLLLEVADLRRRFGQMVRVGAVHEVKAAGKEQKVRVVIGTDPDGKPHLSPWLYTSNARGKAREERRYQAGQNVMLVSPDGDFRQAAVLPWAENENSPRPDHASDDAETYQFEKLRITKKADGYEVWLAEGDGGAAAMKVRLNTDGGITARVGKMRFAAHSMGAKLRAENDFVVVMPGKIIVSKPPIVDKDPIPNDDA